MASTPPSPTSAGPLPTLTQQLYRLASGRVTSVDLVTRALSAIEASQPSLNAFRVVLGKQALAEAAEADRKRAAGQDLPLLGIPIAVKDDVDVAGVPTRFGTSFEGAPATADAEVVRRLRAAGAVIVGKTNTCELGQWPFTSGPAFGHTRNPWSREHTPGGSSGGSAAAVAAGFVTAAIGSDGAGSVRIPAAWTHLVGIKPQRGRISTWPLPEAFNGITVNGVLARTVTDAALVLDAAAGNVDGDLHKPPAVRASDYVGQRGRTADGRDVDEVSVHDVPHHPAPRDPRRPGVRRRPAPRPRAHRHDRRSRLRAADVVELPVAVDVGVAGLG